MQWKTVSIFEISSCEMEGLTKMTQRHSQGGPGVPVNRFVSHVLSKQPTTGGKNDVNIW